MHAIVWRQDFTVKKPGEPDMQREEFGSTCAMSSWLKSATGIVIVSVGFLGAGEKLYTNMTSASKISGAIEECQLYGLQGAGKCFVEYEPNQSDPLPEDLDCNRYIGAIVVQMRMRRSLRLYGGIQRLLPWLSGYEYLVSMRQPVGALQTCLVLVRMPEDPTEVDELKAILLSEGAFSVTVPDGSGEIHTGNTYWGQNSLRPV